MLCKSKATLSWHYGMKYADWGKLHKNFFVVTSHECKTFDHVCILLHLTDCRVWTHMQSKDMLAANKHCCYVMSQQKCDILESAHLYYPSTKCSFKHYC